MADLVKVKVAFPNAKEIVNVFADRYSPYSLSRYKRKAINYDGVYSYATMYPEDMKVSSDTYIKYIVKASDKNRLDFIAQTFYGNASLYWVIGYYNSIADPFNVPVGTELRIPPVSSLYVSGGVLS